MQDAVADDHYRISDLYSVTYSPSLRTLWSYWGPAGRACYTRELIADILRGLSTISDGSAPFARELRHLVLCSSFRRVFNLGGDLDLFCALIENRDRDGLRQYGVAAIDLMELLYSGLGERFITFALIEGACAGGGLESVMACDYVVAEKHVEFSFPEVRLGLFPGMGAITLLSRRLTRRQFDELFHTGRTFRADQLCEMGVVDHVADTGRGREAVVRLVQSRQAAFDAHRSMLVARKRALGLDRGHMLETIDAWVDCALALDRRRLSILRKLSAEQLAV